MPDSWIAEYYRSGMYRQTLGIPKDRMDANELERSKDVLEFIKSSISSVEMHLDIGSSNGVLLELVHNQYDCDWIGYDLGKHDDPNWQEGVFDLVSAIHVLEHTINPVTELKRWVTISRRYVLIEVPGENCPGGPLRFPHLYYIPMGNLIGMMQKAGLSIIKSETTIKGNSRVLGEKL
jgi:hypothetical protein